MSLRLKTIEFACSTVTTTLASATKRVLTGATQIFIPESTITFKSCMLEVIAASDAATAASLTSPIIGIKLGNAAETTVTLANPNAQSGEGEVWQFSIDVTSYFTTNWTGTAMAWYASFQGTGIATANHAAKITITYEYEESTSNTQIKTIRIPIESTRTQLTASFQTIGGALAIPPLKGTYLPETGITIRQMFLDIETNDAMNSTTNFTGQFRINAGTTTDFWRSGISTLNSARWAHSYYDFTALNLTGSTYYSLEMQSTLTARFDLPGGMIVCTYEYNATGSTTIYNSLLLDCVSEPGSIGSPTVANGGIWEKYIYIEEPAPIAIKESGIGLYFIDTGSFTLNVRVSGNTSGQTAFQSYTATAGALQCGQYSTWHRIDSGGQNTKGLYLTRGKNKYTIYYYSGVDQAGWNLSGKLILNYTSGKHTNGVGSHAHTCFQYVMDNDTPARVQKSATQVACPIPETNYNLIGLVNYIACTTGAASDNGFNLNAEILENEYETDDGWLSIHSGMARTDAENENVTMYSSSSQYFKRWNGDPDSKRLNIISSRYYRLDSCPLNYAYCGYYYTYNNITYTISGICSNYTGDGSNINVDVYRVINSTYDEPILNLTTISGGIFSGTWIDNNETLYVTARQSTNRLGRSGNGIAF